MTTMIAALFLFSPLAIANPAPASADLPLSVRPLDADGTIENDAVVMIDGEKVDLDAFGWATKAVQPGNHQVSVGDREHGTRTSTVRVDDAGMAVTVKLDGTAGDEQVRVSFEAGSAVIPTRERDRLLALAKQLRQQSVPVTVEGYSDPLGTHTDNLILAQARARAVEAVLEDGGLDALNVRSVEHGESTTEQVPESTPWVDRRVVVVNAALEATSLDE